MKKKTLTFFPCIFFLSLLSGCSLFEPDDAWLKPIPPSNTLPPITQTGANTFGCKVNGQVWLPTTVWVDSHNGGIVIDAKNAYSPGSTVIITIEDFIITGSGSYKFGANTPYLSKGLYRYGTNRYYTDTTCEGFLNISRLDSLNSIISGTFSFESKDISTGKTIQISEGRFDNKYN